MKPINRGNFIPVYINGDIYRPNKRFVVLQHPDYYNLIIEVFKKDGEPYKKQPSILWDRSFDTKNEAIKFLHDYIENSPLPKVNIYARK